MVQHRVHFADTWGRTGESCDARTGSAARRAHLYERCSMNSLTYADLGLVESEMPRKKLKGFSYYERLRLQVKDLQDGCYVFLDSYACMTDCMTLFIAYASMPVPYGLPHEWREVARWEDPQRQRRGYDSRGHYGRATGQHGRGCSQ